MIYHELPPIQESTRDYEAIEKRLKVYFRRHLYRPIIAMMRLSEGLLRNARRRNPLMDALFAGILSYSNGVFSGKFTADTSKALRELGAQFNSKEGTWRLPQLPAELRNMVTASEQHFQKKLAEVDQKLSQILPAEIAKKFKCEDLFDRTIWKVDEQFRKNVRKLAITPHIPPGQRKQIAAEWQNNMELWIKDWTEEEIKNLRKKVRAHVFEGNRQESLSRMIQSSYRVSENKAKFLARQETSLLMAKLKEVRYTSAGIMEYRWGCVHQPHDKSPNQHTPGNVRYSHGILEGKIFRWDSPPVTTNPGEKVRRNNPGQDYSCRCFARPLLRKLK